MAVGASLPVRLVRGRLDRTAGPARGVFPGGGAAGAGAGAVSPPPAAASADFSRGLNAGLGAGSPHEAVAVPKRQTDLADQIDVPETRFSPHSVGRDAYDAVDLVWAASQASTRGRALVYLRELFIKNSGPVRDFQAELAFTPDGLPVPHLIVGRNGSGKTNLLSLIADALMEGAATVYNDIVTQAGVGRNFFRVVGGKTITYNEPGCFSIFRFEHDGQQYFYNEHAGAFTPEQVREMVPPSLQAAVSWDDSDSGKNFSMPKDIVRSVYTGGAHVFFPSSRSEAPFWLNQNSIIEDEFDTRERYSQSLNKPIYVEHGVELFAQWLLGVLTESRARLVPSVDPQSGQARMNIVDAEVFENASSTLEAANQLLQAIVNDPQAHFVWIGRRQTRKVGVMSGNRFIAAGLDSLSGGQASLLAMFGTILRYGDTAELGPQDIPGVVLIDELDAHMHLDLQVKTVPKLIAMFPRVQFIISTHSPIFLLGMEKQFPKDDLKILEMPRGKPLTAEAYEEFAQAFEVLQDTEAFENKLESELAATQTPVVWFEGELDERYFKCAAKLWGYKDLIDSFNWIGALGNKSGPYNSGDTALNHAVSLLRANPEFTKRKVVLVYDCDTKKPNETFGSITVMGLTPIPDRKVQKGVENLILPEAIPEELYKTKVTVSDYGETTKSEKLDKTALCTLLCGEDADASNFADFAPVLQAIRSALTVETVSEAKPTLESQPQQPPDSAV